MKSLAVFCVLAFACVSATEVIWMEMLSREMVEADYRYHKANENIPQLATKLKLNTLVKFVGAANLTDALSGEGPFTVFGPTDEAFAELPAKFVEILTKNKTLLQMILKFHVAQGNVMSKDLSNDEQIPSLEGSKIRINEYTVDDKKVITASGRVVINPDNEASNGVIHVVDKVLFPAAGTIEYIVSKCPAMKTLNTAVTVAGLGDFLKGEGPYTLFAPSDCAFDKIPKPCLEKLLANKKKLTEVLEYHVVNSTAYSAGLTCGEKVKTIEGSDVHIRKYKDHVKVNCAHVTYADGSATNGVIHLIDRVLIPREMNDFCPELSEEKCDEDVKEPVKAPFLFNFN